MSKINIAINGLGRIGRIAWRAASTSKKLNIVAVNELAIGEMSANLLRHDTVYGDWRQSVRFVDNNLIVQGKKINYFSEKEPLRLPWRKLGVDIVLECTGVFRDYNEARSHLKAGAKKVILSAPAKGVKTFVLGVNGDKYNSETDHIISNASCTTNCYAPITKILHNKFGIDKGYMATVHAVTNDQKIVDAGAKSDLRRARSGLVNIIPTTSGSEKAIGEAIPELAGKLHTMAMRVPVQVGSVIYAIYQLSQETTAEAVNRVIKTAAGGEMKGLINYSEEPLVSSDIVGSNYSAIFDSLLTEADGNIVKVVAWYDNEWGYTSRLIELAEKVAENL